MASIEAATALSRSALPVLRGNRRILSTLNSRHTFWHSRTFEQFSKEPWPANNSNNRSIRFTDRARCSVPLSNDVKPCVPASARQYHAGRIHRQWVSGIGAEPGIDPESDEPTPEHADSRLQREVEIKIIDYSDQRIVQHEPDESSMSTLLSEGKPDWAACRWIYVNGLSWGVVKTISNNQRLHRLVIEDVLNTRTPTKVDWYKDHCFMVMTLQKLVHLQRDGHGPVPAPRSSPSPEDTQDALRHDQSHQSGRQRLLSRHRLAMSVEQVSAFLTADNTVITIFEHSGPDVLTPILTRLNSPQTMVRSSNDPSMLVQAVVDAVVDLSIPIGRALNEAFSDLELAVLTNPSLAQSRQLYILRSELSLLLDVMMPIGGLVRTLCDHRAMSDQLDSTPAYPHNRASPVPQHVANVSISPMTQAYLKDVQDHVTMLTSSTHTAIRAAENLTSLIFNTITARQNESVRQLTLVSIFFLPLTFLTGYFGMNFDPMPIVNNHSDTFFWYIATPVMLSVVLFLATKAAWSRFGPRMARRRATSSPIPDRRRIR